MRIYEYRGKDIDKLIKQNDGEVIDCIEGCLLDDMLVECKRGLMAILETYINPNMSGYRIYFSNDRDEVWKLWEDRQLSVEGV